PSKRRSRLCTARHRISSFCSTPVFVARSRRAVWLFSDLDLAVVLHRVARARSSGRIQPMRSRLRALLPPLAAAIALGACSADPTGPAATARAASSPAAAAVELRDRTGHVAAAVRLEGASGTLQRRPDGSLFAAHGWRGEGDLIRRDVDKGFEDFVALE